MQTGTDERRLVIEIISTLINLRKAMADLILKPAGVPMEVYKPLLAKKDESTGAPISKRLIASEVLEAIAQRGDCTEIIRGVIKIAANWSSFHLAKDEFAARATVQKAREILGVIQTMEAREAKQREIARKQEVEKLEQERAEMLSKQSELLLMMFEQLVSSSDAHGRGYLLQDLLNRLFDLHEIPVVGSFTRNSGGEQIDGAFKLEGWHYIVECRWREKLADIRELDGLTGQIGRSGKQTMGVYLSINGWSKNVPNLLKQNKDKSVILMDGYDLRCALTRQIDLREFLLAKIEKLNLDTEPFFGATEFLNGG